MTASPPFTDPAALAAIAARITRPVVLVGLMGVGKTTVGRKLATLLGTDFVDADEAIVEAAQRSIPEIFETFGEAYFRDGERRVIARLMEEGQVDLMSNLKFSEDRAKFMVLLPYETTIAESVFLLRSDKRPLTQFSQLKNLTVASIRGYLYSENTMQFIQQNRSHVAEVESIESGLEMLYRGRVDALISPTVSTSDAIFSTSSYQDRFRIAALNISTGNNAHINIGVSRQSQYINLLPAIERHIKAMQTDGTVKRLYTDMVLSPRIKQLKVKPE